mgnify:CR=1 FL=1
MDISRNIKRQLFRQNEIILNKFMISVMPSVKPLPASVSVASTVKVASSLPKPKKMKRKKLRKSPRKIKNFDADDHEEKLDKHSHTIIKNIDNAANAALKPFEEMEQKSSKIKSYLNEKVMTAKKELNRTETSAIMAINECGNVHIHNMKESQDQCNNTINIMRAEKSISLTSIQDIRRLNKHLEEKILHQYENFQEKIALYDLP